MVEVFALCLSSHRRRRHPLRDELQVDRRCGHARGQGQLLVMLPEHTGYKNRILTTFLLNPIQLASASSFLAQYHIRTFRSKLYFISSLSPRISNNPISLFFSIVFSLIYSYLPLTLGCRAQVIEIKQTLRSTKFLSFNIAQDSSYAALTYQCGHS